MWSMICFNVLIYSAISLFFSLCVLLLWNLIHPSIWREEKQSKECCCKWQIWVIRCICVINNLCSGWLQLYYTCWEKSIAKVGDIYHKPYTSNLFLSCCGIGCSTASNVKNWQLKYAHWLWLQLYLSCHAASPRSFAGQMAATCLKESLAEWYGCQTCQIHRSDTMKILMARLESCKDGPAQGQREDCSDGSDMNKNGEGSVSQVNELLQSCERIQWCGPDQYWAILAWAQVSLEAAEWSRITGMSLSSATCMLNMSAPSASWLQFCLVFCLPLAWQR